MKYRVYRIDSNKRQGAYGFRVNSIFVQYLQSAGIQVFTVNLIYNANNRISIKCDIKKVPSSILHVNCLSIK